MDTKTLVELLSRPDAYRHPVSGVEVLQTHISVLFFAGERVYKVKKPVDMGFLDYTSLARRKHFCEEEVRLNRRLGQRVHLGVVPIARDVAGKVRVCGTGTVLEYAVEMVRLDASRMLDVLLEAGEIDNEMIGELAKLLVDFHGRVASGEGVDEYGSPDAVRGLVLENLDECLRFVVEAEDDVDPEAATVSRTAHRFLVRRARAFLDAQGELLLRRVAQGRIREGHGDLHAANICFGAQGIDVYDCIEFSRRLRCGDVACDLAFLLMDLDFRGFAAFGGFLARRYAELSGDPELSTLLTFYKAYRAVVRAKIASIVATDADFEPHKRRASRLLAMRYFHLAAAYELPPSLILCCGLPASGKSWLAQRVAQPFNAVLLASDVRRKILAGAPREARPGEAYGEGLYGEERKQETYRSLLEMAREGLGHGRTVVVDATFARREWRDLFARAARELGRACFVLHLSVSEATALERLAERAGDAHARSEADAQVYRRAREEFEEPAEVPHDRLVSLRGDAPVEDSVARFVDAAILAADRSP